MRAGGGTAMSTWLRLADQLFATRPAGDAAARDPAHRRQERVGAARRARPARSAAAPGTFQCDCRGVGADWDVAELREIATALLGTVDLIADPADIAEDFRRR